MGLSFVFTTILIEKHRSQVSADFSHYQQQGHCYLALLFSGRPAVTPKSLLRTFRVVTFGQTSGLLFLLRVLTRAHENLELLNREWPAAVSLLPKAMALCPPPAAPSTLGITRDHKRVALSHGPIIITLCSFSLPDVLAALPGKGFVIVCVAETLIVCY